MLEVKLTAKVPNWETKKMDEKVISGVVASTKTLNIMVEETQQKGYTVGSISRKEIYLDKQKTANVLSGLVNSEFANKEPAIKQAIVDHCMDMLNRGCVFYKPPVKRGNNK